MFIALDYVGENTLALSDVEHVFEEHAPALQVDTDRKRSNRPPSIMYY